jgi:hypothetical protein
MLGEYTYDEIFYEGTFCSGPEAEKILRAYPTRPSPAIHPVVQAAWKLKPPVMASISRISPAKKMPGSSLLSMV